MYSIVYRKRCLVVEEKASKPRHHKYARRHQRVDTNSPLPRFEEIAHRIAPETPPPTLSPERFSFDLDFTQSRHTGRRTSNAYQRIPAGIERRFPKNRVATLSVAPNTSQRDRIIGLIGIHQETRC